METPIPTIEADTPLVASTLASFFLLNALECSTAVELLEQNPTMDDEKWLDVTTLLEEKGIEPRHIGLLLSLYPQLADNEIVCALEASETQWFNSAIKAVLQIKASIPQIYYGSYVVDDTKKFTNLALVGQKIADERASHSDEEVLVQLIEKPELFAARRLKVKAEDRLRQLHLDPELLNGAQLELFNERIATLDKKAPDYMACLGYIFDQIINTDRNKALKIIGLEYDKIDNDLLTIIDAFGADPPIYALARLKSLYTILGGSGVDLRTALIAVPNFLTNYHPSFEDLTIVTGISQKQLEELRRSMNVSSKAVKKAYDRHNRLAPILEEAPTTTDVDYDAVILQLAEVGLSLQPPDVARLKKAYPEFKTLQAFHRSRTRIRALKAVIGDQLACLVIEDNLGYLGEDHPGVVISGELPLTQEQKNPASNRVTQ